MDITEVTDEVGDALEPQIAGAVPCEECGAPLDRLQRYCVSCGTRRLAVPDPATAYLAQASARARVRQRAAAAGARGTSRRGRWNNTTALLALIAILVAIGVGVLIGHATKSGATTTVSAVSSTPAASTTTTPSSSSSATKGNTSGVDNKTGAAYLKKELHNSGSSVSVP